MDISSGQRNGQGDLLDRRRLIQVGGLGMAPGGKSLDDCAVNDCSGANPTNAAYTKLLGCANASACTGDGGDCYSG